MRSLIIAAALIAGATAAVARPDTLRMTCNQARAVVASQGAAVLGSGPNIYDRYVADRRFCPPGDVARASYVQTIDAPYCPVGGVCVTPESSRRHFRR